jgi:hypothetical protein
MLKNINSNDDRLLKESQKRFKQLCEYTFIGVDDLREADDDEDSLDNQEQQPLPGGNADTAPQGNEEQPLPGGGPEQGQEGGEEEMPDAEGGDDGVEGFDPEGDGGDDIPDEMSDEGGDEEVIDVDDLTNAQEQGNAEIGQVDNKIQSLLAVVDKLMKRNDDVINKIDSVNGNIEAFAAEMEKRNPTQVEKLTLRAKDSYPFSITPDEYWKDKEANSNYSTADDENGEEQGQYVITQNDINGDTDWRSIAKSLNDPNLNQSLSQILKY